ncbi:pirin [Pusillimonas sp. CC-YST705]|uniref:Pirin n=1 Tax=Mesopusillimonas faecipullorum TaxID=2755040 RepID=A0ABS8CG35_9BURK|nr:replication protein RepA [Mesopusillimonas faecipullorum]MCB5364991.1 pirin [Mesopusillimonas faecipullorum]
MAENKDTKSYKRIMQLVENSMAIEAEAAKEAGAVGYMARALVQATMPHSKPTETSFVRENGAFSMAIMAHPKVGLPYGSVPRLLVAYLTTEAVRTKSREIELGDSLSAFMAELGEVPTGGRRGSITRVKEQTRRLFASNIACTYTADDMDAGVNLAVADSYELWWNPKNPEQGTVFSSFVKLGERFFEEVTQNPVPVDLRALQALKKSPMALDTYCWLTYRMSYLSKPTVIPWAALQMQFGAEFGRIQDFKKGFLKHLKAVLLM